MMSSDCNGEETMATNETSALALLASFPELPDSERERLEAGLSPEGREVAAAIREFRAHNGFSMSRATSSQKVAELYLRWADKATVEPPTRK
jgi:hypothetical protein